MLQNYGITRLMLAPRSKFIFIAIVALGCLAGAIAHAAPLTYSTAETISLSSPATNFTIAAGSLTDSLQVNATSVIVTLSSSTGGSFTLTSASYDLTIASSSAGGTASLSCTSGVASVTLSQATGQTNYTITPTASQCTTPSNNSGGSGGGGGGDSAGVSNQYGSPYTPGGGGSISSTASSSGITQASSTTTSTAALEAQINSLLALLATLKAQAGQHGAPLTTAGPAHMFHTALQFRDSGSGVRYLQEFLGEDNAIYPEGRVTGYFGTLTLQAVQRFQKKYGISKAGDTGYGYVGTMTRAKLNSLIEQGIGP
jgi:hypothetical protein